MWPFREGSRISGRRRDDDETSSYEEDCQGNVGETDGVPVKVLEIMDR
jgi:hypothetical protein